MEKKNIELQNRNVPYRLRVSMRSRALRFTVSSGGIFTVTSPRYLSWETVLKFINQKSKWILDAIDSMSAFPISVSKKVSNAGYLKYKNEAMNLAQEKVEKFNQLYNFKYNKISIRNQKSRWGSCSGKRNLSFNYKIVLIPEHLADYIIVHELCHLGQLNHSRSFWNLVAQTIPHYKNSRVELRKMV